MAARRGGMKLPHFVYAVGSAVSIPPHCRYLKIGRTTDPVKRMSGLQCGRPVPLAYAMIWEFEELHQASKIESHVHQRFRESQVRNEWFDVSLESVNNLVVGVAGKYKYECRKVFDCREGIAKW